MISGDTVPQLYHHGMAESSQNIFGSAIFYEIQEHHTDYFQLIGLVFLQNALISYIELSRLLWGAKYTLLGKR